jgi:MFS superfamily sulfate permease-like transporter
MTSNEAVVSAKPDTVRVTRSCESALCKDCANVRVLGSRYADSDRIAIVGTIFRVHGPFLFGATDTIAVVTEKIHELPPIVIIRLRNMTAIDATGLFALEEIAKQLHATKRTLILCGAREQPAQLIHQAEFEEVVGRDNICANVQEALRRAEEVFEKIDAGAAVSGQM